MADPATHTHERRPLSLLGEYPILTGIAVGALSLLPHFFLHAEASLGYAAILIALIAGIYFGFAVMNGSGREQMIEFSVAGMFAVAALVGLLYWPIVLPLAYFTHAGWDLAHHNPSRFSLVEIPSWYVPWCVVIDVIVGAGMLAIWWSVGIL